MDCHEQHCVDVEEQVPRELTGDRRSATTGRRTAKPIPEPAKHDAE